jgi:hypothetical protein
MKALRVGLLVLAGLPMACRRDHAQEGDPLPSKVIPEAFATLSDYVPDEKAKPIDQIVADYVSRMFAWKLDDYEIWHYGQNNYMKQLFTQEKVGNGNYIVVAFYKADFKELNGGADGGKSLILYVDLRGKKITKKKQFG